MRGLVLDGGPVVHQFTEGVAADALAARGGRAAMEDDVLRTLREGAPCGLAALSDPEIAVHHFADPATDGVLTFYRASAPCSEPDCAVFARENRWVLALHRLLDGDTGVGARDLSWTDPLERALAEFEGVYWWAARHPTPERLEQAARWREELARLAAERFPDFPPLIPAGATGGRR
ncbi:hypothetical protein ACOMD4_37430 [Streptomyces anulatus]|uniref:hypothetical protein n=1 Tax=Streptomyces anulatus TaxID=1892 RepID=UPI003B76DCF8